MEHHGRLGRAEGSGKSDDQAKDYLSKLFDHVSCWTRAPVRPSRRSRREGRRDARYENEAITAQQKGEDINYVLPDDTILIENPAAVTTETKNPKAAKAFLDFLTTPEAQKIYAAKGYRTVLDDLKDEQKYPTPTGLFDITKFGGWSKVHDEFFDPEGGIVADIFQSRGVDCLRLAPLHLFLRGESRAALPGAALGRGIAIGYLSVIALIPLSAVVLRATDKGWDGFWTAVSSPQAVAASPS